MWLATDHDVHLLLGSNLQTVDLAEDLYFMQFQFNISGSLKFGLCCLEGGVI